MPKLRTRFARSLRLVGVAPLLLLLSVPVLYADPLELEPLQRPDAYCPVRDPSVMGEDLSPALLSLAVEHGRAARRNAFARELQPARPGALSGKRIALSPGHGITIQDNGSWGWQRDLTQNLREDIHNNQWAIDFLIPMLERAGAEVINVRERSYQEHAVVLDNSGPGYSESGTWADGASAGFQGGYRYAYLSAEADARAAWSFELPESGVYPVYAFYLSGTNRSAAAQFAIEHAFGRSEGSLDQSDVLVETWATAVYPNTPPHSNANREPAALWRYLGSYPFRANTSYRVELSNQGLDPEQVVIADAIRIGGGLGEVPNGSGQVSGQARWAESAATYLQWLDVPAWMKVGDVSSRPLYAIYRGVDMYLGMHTNCCNSSGTSTWVWYPTMYVSEPSWAAGHATSNLPPGTYELAKGLQREVVARVRARYDANWPMGSNLQGADFGELRAIRNAWYEDVNTHHIDPPMAIPAALMEFAFHDTAYDARLIREQGFREDIARGMLVAVLRFYGGPDAVLPPLPPQAISAQVEPAGLRLSWQPRSDALAPQAEASGYRIYRSNDGELFGDPVETSETSILLPLDACAPLYVKLSAFNQAGESLDSAVLVAQRPHPGGARILYVDGVDREVKQVQDPNNLRSYARIYGPALTDALPGAGIDTCTDELVAQVTAAQDYDLVVWATGETSVRDGSLDAAEQSALRALREQEVPVLLSGAELYWHLATQAGEQDRLFVEQVLGVGFVDDDANSTTVDASSLSLPSALAFGDCSADAVCVEYPDVLAPLAGGSVLLYYPGGGAAAVQAAGGLMINVGFPLESVAEPSQRKALISALSALLLNPALASHEVCEEELLEDEELEELDEVEPVEQLEELEQAELVEASPETVEDGEELDTVEGAELEPAEDVAEGELQPEALQPQVESGCGCVLGTQATRPGWAVVLALSLGLALLRRRRAAAHRAQASSRD
ncbi:MAG: hypothetical protein RBU37_00300 [Myxococcota bacterium]|nr:hypothetical protein [Myxococcota bacterium]